MKPICRFLAMLRLRRGLELGNWTWRCPRNLGGLLGRAQGRVSWDPAAQFSTLSCKRYKIKNKISTKYMKYLAYELNHSWGIAPTARWILIVATLLGMFFRREWDLKFSTGNYFNCTCIRHTCIIRRCLLEIHNIFGTNPVITPQENNMSLSGSIWLSTGQVVTSPTHDTLSLTTWYGKNSQNIPILLCTP